MEIYAELNFTDMITILSGTILFTLKYIDNLKYRKYV